MLARWIEGNLSTQLRIEGTDFVQIHGVAQRFDLSQADIGGGIDHAGVKMQTASVDDTGALVRS